METLSHFRAETHITWSPSRIQHRGRNGGESLSSEVQVKVRENTKKIEVNECTKESEK